VLVHAWLSDAHRTQASGKRVLLCRCRSQYSRQRRAKTISLIAFVCQHLRLFHLADYMRRVPASNCPAVFSEYFQNATVYFRQIDRDCVMILMFPLM